MRRGRRWVVVLVAGAALALVSQAGAGAAKAPVWQVQPTVNPDATDVTNSTFAGVSASGPSEAWAVGTFQDANALDNPLAEHWDGAAWHSVTIPEPAGQQAKLSAVDDLAPNNAWAVGTSFSGGAGATPAGQTLIEHWDGSAWSIVPSPNPASGAVGDEDVLDAITGTGPSDLWAAGWASNGTDTISMVFEHWNGSGWTAAPSPTPPGSFQFASGITAVSTSNVWAVGFDQTNGSVTLAAHWDGSAWSIVPTPNVTSAGGAQNTLTAVGTDAAGDVWASGYAFNVNGQNTDAPYVLHWNGASWTMTNVPEPATGEGSSLSGIRVLSAKDAWAVGQSGQDNGGTLSLTEHFNGKTWSIVPSPDPGQISGIPVNTLASVGGVGAGSLFAVGVQETDGQCCQRTLAIHTTQG